MSCTVDDRDRVERAARALRDTVPTAQIDTTPPTKSQYDDWTLDAVLVDTEGVPPTVLRELALADLTLRPTPSQAGHQHVVATA
ncbi:hypothetical protein [Haloarcula sp. JP-L23]|uniref:hypothetical protein n=1 Tax=Haloarcula sp. JP-L23 TaxID=2716717 RepID=UPI00140ED766|nr:hypothetical protein G9465_25040 [Haloarcula sp. JP-L23]